MPAVMGPRIFKFRESLECRLQCYRHELLVLIWESGTSNQGIKFQGGAEFLQGSKALNLEALNPKPLKPPENP